MKITTIAALFFSFNVYASGLVCSEQASEEMATETKVITTDVPNHLKGAMIIVRQADGRESAVPAEKFKVVPRKQQFVVTRTEKTKLTSCTSNDSKNNRVSLLGGYGAQGGLKSSQSVNVVEVESKTGLVGGAQYHRRLNDVLSIGVQGQTNKTGSVLIGIDF